MSNEKYNGWTNRSTWVVNLHYGDSEEWLQEMVNTAEGDIGKLADYLQEEISNQVEEVIGENGFVSDLVNLSEIDWWELAAAYTDTYWEEEEEEEEEVDMVCPQCAMTSTFLSHEVGQFVVCDCCWDHPVLITKAEFDTLVEEGKIHPGDFE